MATEAVTLPYEAFAYASRKAFRHELNAAGLYLTPRQLPNERPDQERLLAKIDDLLVGAVDVSRSVTVPDARGRSVEVSVTIVPALQRLRGSLVERMLSGAMRDVRTDLEAAVAKLPDDQAQAMQGQVDKLRSAEDLATEQQALDEADGDRQWRLALMTKQDELAAAKWNRLTAKDSIATIIGGLLLLIMTITFIVSMFTGTVIPELVSNAFLLILGYFFGQGASRGGREG